MDGELDAVPSNRDSVVPNEAMVIDEIYTRVVEREARVGVFTPVTNRLIDDGLSRLA